MLNEKQRNAADAAFLKQERAKDASVAMQEYVAQGKAVRANTARLKELRLAKEIEEKNDVLVPKTKKLRKPKAAGDQAPSL